MNKLLSLALLFTINFANSQGIQIIEYVSSYTGSNTNSYSYYYTDHVTLTDGFHFTATGSNELFVTPLIVNMNPPTHSILGLNESIEFNFQNNQINGNFDAAIKVHGSKSGRISGIWNSNGSKLTFTPANPYLASEKITVFLSDQLTNSSGFQASREYYAEYIAEVTSFDYLGPLHTINQIAYQPSGKPLITTDLNKNGLLDIITYPNMAERQNSGLFKTIAIENNPMEFSTISYHRAPFIGDVIGQHGELIQRQEPSGSTYTQNNLFSVPGFFVVENPSTNPFFYEERFSMILLDVRDIDNDGKLNFLIANDNSLYDYEYDESNTNAQGTLIFNLSSQGYFIKKGIITYINTDSNPDYLIGTQKIDFPFFFNKEYTDKIEVLHGQNDGSASFVKRIDVTGSYGYWFEDFDNDGTLDIIINENTGELDWYEGPSYSSKVNLADGLGDIKDIKLVSISGNQDKEFIVTNGNNIFLIESTGKTTLSDADAQEIDSYDFDGDGDMDLIGKNGSDIFWLENRGGLFESEISLFPDFVGDQIITADLNENGKVDILTTDEARSGVLLNNAPNTFAINPSSATSIDSHYDLDYDGDIDFIGGNNSYTLTGLGSFLSSPLGVTGLINTKPIDIDSDGDIDFIGSKESPDNNLYLYRNNGRSYSPEILSNDFGSTRSIVTGDINNDGTVDIIAAYGSASESNSHKIALFKNNVTSFSSSVINSDRTNDLVLADLNQDGFLDISYVEDLSTTIIPLKVLWNNNGSFSLQTFESLTSPNIKGVVDYNADDKLDIIVYENGGLFFYSYDNGNFIKTELPNAAFGDVEVFDYENDGDIDILIATGSSLYLHINELVFPLDPLETVVTEVNAPNFTREIIAENSSSEYIISPNPVSDFLTIRSVSEDTQPFEFSIITLEGKVILNEIATPGNSINLTTLQPGIFVVKISRNNGTIESHLIKK